MVNTEIEKLWNQFNELEIEELLHYSRIDILNRILKICPDEAKTDYKKEVDFAWTIQIIGHWLDRFNPDMRIVKQTINEFVDAHKSDFEYFRKRLDEAKTDLLKWHYCLACYFLKRGEHIKDAIKYILANAENSRKENELLNCVSLLVFSYNLNKIFGVGLENIINDYALKIINEFDDNPRYFLEPIEVIVKLNIIDSTQIKSLIELLLKKSESIEDQHISEKLYRRVLLLCTLNKEETNEIRISVLKKLASKFESLGDAEKEELLKIHHYENAQKEYQKLGDADKIDSINKKIRNSHDEISWEKHEHNFTVPKLNIPGETGHEKVVSISNFADMIPSIHKTEELVDELKEKYPISYLFPRTSFNHEQPISHSTTDEEIRQAQINEELNRTITLTEVILSSNVEKLEKDREIKPEDYFDYIRSFGVHNETSIKIIKSGIERHFAGDFISSIHNLIPQIEYTVRQILQSKGIRTTRLKKDIIHNALLDSLIERGKFIFGEDLTKYLLFKFTRIEGMNQRNKVCHGSMNSSMFTHTTSLSLIYVIIILTKLSVRHL